MADQPRSEQEFREFMANQSELSSIYQQSDLDGPNDLLDQRILAAARKAVAQQHGLKSQRKRWLIPAAIAAGFAVLAIVLAVQYHNLDSDDLALVSHQQEQERQVVSNLKPDPTRLLDQIVQLVKDNKIAVARDQYDAFNELYPDYLINYQAYPELEQFRAQIHK